MKAITSLISCAVIWFVSTIIYSNNAGGSGIYVAASIIQLISSICFSIILLFVMAKFVANRKFTTLTDSYLIAFFVASLGLVYTRIHLSFNSPSYVGLLASSMDFYSKNNFVIEYLPTIIFSAFFWLLLSILKTLHSLIFSIPIFFAAFFLMGILKKITKAFPKR